jgi:hypothetical protein
MNPSVAPFMSYCRPLIRLSGGLFESNALLVIKRVLLYITVHAINDQNEYNVMDLVASMYTFNTVFLP